MLWDTPSALPCEPIPVPGDEVCAFFLRRPNESRAVADMLGLVGVLRLRSTCMGLAKCGMVVCAVPALVRREWWVRSIPNDIAGRSAVFEGAQKNVNFHALRWSWACGLSFFELIGRRLDHINSADWCVSTVNAIIHGNTKIARWLWKMYCRGPATPRYAEFIARMCRHASCAAHVREIMDTLKDVPETAQRVIQYICNDARDKNFHKPSMELLLVAGARANTDGCFRLVRWLIMNRHHDLALWCVDHGMIEDDDELIGLFVLGLSRVYDSVDRSGLAAEFSSRLVAAQQTFAIRVGAYGWPTYSLKI